MSHWIAFVLLLAVAVWSDLAAQVQDNPSNYRAPIAQLAQYEFFEGEPATLTPVSGTWANSAGTLNSSSTTRSIATIDFYYPQSPFFDLLAEISVPKFWYRARMLNQRSGSSTRVGLVYQYQDDRNFYEVSFSPTGSVLVRDVSNGVGTTAATGTYSGGGQNKWFDVQVEWTAAETIVRVNGFIVVRGIKQDGRTHGRVGVISRQTTARFDRLFVHRTWGDQEFRESFSVGAPPWQVIKGNWSVVNGVYRNSAIQHGSITLLPIFAGFDEDRSKTESFEVRARMLNPYGASGNRMGFIYNYRQEGGSATYGEIVFGADGIARLNDVSTSVRSDGATELTVTPRETAPYPWTRNQWFDVRFWGTASIFEEDDDTLNVSVNGTAVFSGVDIGTLNGPLGLVTNWTPGRFDDVWFRHGATFSWRETFDREFPFFFVRRGIWDDEGGVLNNRTAAANDIVYLFYGGLTDYTLRARMLNPYGGPGNRIGLIFNFDTIADDYYEVVFAPTGQAYLNKFIQGQLTPVATGTHSALGSNVWFNVELARRGTNATVKVNNRLVFENVPVAQLDSIGGNFGVISHWAPGRFDDLHFEDFVDR